MWRPLPCVSISVAVCLFCSCSRSLPAVSPTPARQKLPAGKSVGLSRVAGPPHCNFERINETWSVTIKQPAVVAANDAITFAGWAVDSSDKRLASAVDVVVDGTALSADYGVVRADVAEMLNAPAARDSGFRLLVPAGWLEKGRHSCTIRVIRAMDHTYQEGEPVSFEIR